MYPTVQGLRAIVEANRDDGMHELFELHQRRVAAVIEGAGVPATEAMLAGFLNGFVTAALKLADDVEAMADTIDPYLGGIYLYANETPDQRAAAMDEHEFLVQLAEALDGEPAYRDLGPSELDSAVRLVADVFAQTPEVPVNAVSLAGFALGVLYAMPFIAGSPGAASAALLGAAASIARGAG